jgi:Alpha/beta hydrolase of unknown function (DUF900)
MIGALVSALFLVGCWHNNFPTADNFIRPAPSDCRAGQLENCIGSNAVHLFADANGTFYPTGWIGRGDLAGLRSARSLLAAAPAGSEARAFVERAEEQQLREIAALGDGAERIFILVHGYNNTVAEADAAYRMIEARLNAGPNDRIIRFYWDGLTGTDRLGIGSGRIWLYATGNSKLVGARGLRRILNQFQDKPIFLIGHSRGTSVILSALGNPLYAREFYAKTRRLARRRLGLDSHAFMHPAELEDRGNDIHVLVAAPAVGRIDFCDSAAQPENHRRYSCPDARLRPFDRQVKSFRFTVNAGDPVLDKFIGLSNLLNPTGLGLDLRVAQDLCEDGYLLTRYGLPPDSMHGWTWYIAQPAFELMLRDAGILRGDAAPGETPPPVRPCEPA